MKVIELKPNYINFSELEVSYIDINDKGEINFKIRSSIFQHGYYPNDDFYSMYDFDGKTHGRTIISDEDIVKLAQKNISLEDYKRKKRIYKAIVNLAENCSINQKDSKYNFYVSTAGNIELGKHMAYIKEHIDKYKNYIKI